MTLEDLGEQLRAAADQTERLEVLRSFTASRRSQPKPLERAMSNSEFYAEIDALEGSKRESLTQLRHRHLEKIDRIARRTHYDRAGYQEYLVEHLARCAVRRPRKSPPINSANGGWSEYSSTASTRAGRISSSVESLVRNSNSVSWFGCKTTTQNPRRRMP